MPAPNKRRFQWRDLWTLTKQTAVRWNSQRPFRLSAITSYYAVFALPALLVISVWAAGIFFEETAVRQQIVGEIRMMLGEESASAINTALVRADAYADSIWTIVVGIGTLLFGATSLFVQLQESFNDIWRVKQRDNASFWKLLLRDRLFSLGLVLVVGFLLLVSLIVSSALSILSGWIETQIGGIELLRLVDALVGIGAVTFLFALLFKILPDVRMPWRGVWLGAFVTALLFTLGKFLLTEYLAVSDPGSIYGASGALIVILLWVNYTSLILFFGASFTATVTRFYDYEVTPSAMATFVDDKETLPR